MSKKLITAHFPTMYGLIQKFSLLILGYGEVTRGEQTVRIFSVEWNDAQGLISKNS